MNSTSRFTIISYNVCGLANPVRIAELTMFLTSHKPSVLILQEPQINHLPYIKKGNKITPHTPKQLPSFTGYASLYFTHPSKPTGVAFYIHKSCTYKPLHHIPHCTPYRPAQTNTIAGFVWVSSPLLPQPVVVGGVYLHSACRREDVDALATNIALASQPLAGSPPLSPPIPVYVLGDFNARHRSWDPDINDSASKCMKGKWVQQKLLTHTANTTNTTPLQLTLINNMFTTSRHIPTREESETVIDLALTSHPRTVEGMYVMANAGLGSDHWPILVTLSNSYPLMQEPVYAPQEVDMERKYDETDLKQGIPPRQDTYEPLIVKLSTIPGAGYGLFANKRIKKGERIIRYTGELINEAIKNQRYPNNEGHYVLYVMRDMYIDAVDPAISSVARYINSSGGGYNNAKISPYHRGGEHMVNITATRDIAPGHEIFMPYGSSYRLTRAQPPSKSLAPTPTTHTSQHSPQQAPTHTHINTHWEQHLSPPPQHQDDSRVKWRINNNVDWSLFQQHIDSTLQPWINAHKHWMPPRNSPLQQQPRPQHMSGAGTLHACSYTDGASRGNPGPASCGGVIYLAKDKVSPDQDATADPIHSFCTYLGNNYTNNEAEYHGMIQALEAAHQIGITHLTSYVDSQLVCKQLQGKNQVNHPKIIHLHNRCMTLIAQLQHYEAIHIRRAYNKQADHLCNTALDNHTMQSWSSDIPDMIGSQETGLNQQQQQEMKIKQLQQEQDNQVSQHDTNRPDTITQDEIDGCWKQLHDIIISTAQTCIGTVKTSAKSKYWWAHAPDVHALHQIYTRRRRLMRKLKHNSNTTSQQLEEVRKQYLEARADFLTSVQQGKNKEWNEVAAACDNVNERKRHDIVWKKYKRTKPSTRVPAASFPDANGAPPRTHTEALNNMAAHIAKISSISHDDMFDAAHEADVMSYLRNIPEVQHQRHAPSFTFSDVESTCSSFRLNTALGADNISPYFLRYGGRTVHRVMFMLFSICSWYGVVPSAFKHAHVMTLYKGEGEVTNPDSYRPISITSVVARIYERIHKHELLTAMITNGIPSCDQFGFTRQRSTHDAIYRLLSLIVETYETGQNNPMRDRKERNYVPTVFVDISKAYDKVWIEGLLYKLHHDLGITGNLFYMIRAMLTGRTIQVVGDGKISTIFHLLAGVPQGSILAPLLFLIYIHDITQGHTRTWMSLFADDIAVLPSISGKRGMGALSTTLRHMSDYARKWKITFSAKKTNVVYFRPGHISKQADKSLHNHGKLKLSQFSVTSEKSYKYLGVILDQYLTFIPHILDVIKRVNVTSHTISRLVRRDHAPSIPIIQRLVKCVLVPQMTYGFGFLPPHTLKNQKINLQCTGISHGTYARNLHKHLKRALLKPMMRCMGVPHYVHHDSLWVESRLLDLHSLHALSTARLAHRWLSNQLDSTNDAARMFHQHTSNTPTHPSHPFTHITAAITHTPIFRPFQHNPRHLLQIEKHKLKEQVWTHQYNTWLNMTGDHPLHKYYTIHSIPKQKHLPLYTHYDTPGTAANRARLRLARARLRFDQKRMGFADITSTTCRQCHQHDETVDHVMWKCNDNVVKALRTHTYTKLHRLCGNAAFPSSLASLEPHVSEKGKKHILHKAYTITGKLINKLRDIWDF